MADEDPGQWMLALAAARAAINRHADETRRGSLDIYRGYSTAGESLLWLAVLEESLWPPSGTGECESYERRRIRDGRGQVAQGLRFLRNTMVHQQVIGLSLLKKSHVGGLTFPVHFPISFRSSAFRWLGGLPPGKPTRHSGRQFEAYQTHLAEQPTLHTFELALLWVELEIERRGLLPRGNEWLSQTMGVDPTP